MARCLQMSAFEMKKTEQLDGPGRNSRLDHITCDVLSNRAYRRQIDQPAVPIGCEEGSL
jgi:hypothetical protein